MVCPVIYRTFAAIFLTPLPALPRLRALQSNAHQLGQILKAHLGTSYDQADAIKRLDLGALSALEKSDAPESVQQAWHTLHLAIELHNQYVQLGSFHTTQAEELLERAEWLYIKVRKYRIAVNLMDPS